MNHDDGFLGALSFSPLSASRRGRSFSAHCCGALPNTTNKADPIPSGVAQHRLPYNALSFLSMPYSLLKKIWPSIHLLVPFADSVKLRR